jgi:hypothetical protein
VLSPRTEWRKFSFIGDERRFTAFAGPSHVTLWYQLNSNPPTRKQEEWLDRNHQTRLLTCVGHSTLFEIENRLFILGIGGLHPMLPHQSAAHFRRSGGQKRAQWLWAVIVAALLPLPVCC